MTFDGKGKAAGSQQTSRSGSYSPPLPDFPPPTLFSYTVSPIGTFAVMDAGNVISNGVILDGGNEFYSLSRTATTGVIVVGKKMS